MNEQASKLSADSTLSARPAEADLISRTLKGDRRLFHELVRPYERAVFVTIYSIVRSREDAEDAAQETMLKALTRLHQLQSPEKFKGWLLQIALNEARLKRRGRRDHLYESLDEEKETEDGSYQPHDLADWREIPSQTLERKEIREAVAGALQRLSPLYREIFVLRDVQQLPVTECAQLLGISEQAVKVRSHRARMQMRERLAPVFKKRWLDRLPLPKWSYSW